MKRNGPPPLPTAVKVLRGNPGKRALNDREPKPVMQKPRCPAWLPKEAKAEWRRMAGFLFDAGLLTAVDRAALAGYCVSWARWKEAERMVEEKGTILRTAKGNLIQNPYLAVANRAMREMQRWILEFGMTPSARSRIRTADDGSAEPTLAELLFSSVNEE